jgi:hypothetical protein
MLLLLSSISSRHMRYICTRLDWIIFLPVIVLTETGNWKVRHLLHAWFFFIVVLLARDDDTYFGKLGRSKSLVHHSPSATHPVFQNLPVWLRTYRRMYFYVNTKWSSAIFISISRHVRELVPFAVSQYYWIFTRDKSTRSIIPAVSCCRCDPETVPSFMSRQLLLHTR